jgi:hypothetical protein
MMHWSLERREALRMASGMRRVANLDGEKFGSCPFKDVKVVEIPDAD